jgi:hypothetical protein
MIRGDHPNSPRAADLHAATVADRESERETRHVSKVSLGSLTASATMLSGSSVATEAGASATTPRSARIPKSHPE